MKRKILFVVISCFFISVSLSAGGSTAFASFSPRVALPPDDNKSITDVSFFYDQLAPYGSWSELSGYGWVWTPRNIATGWRPYTVGRWAYTDDGWTWVSDEEWGWATYHYGRWLFDQTAGWVWIPGTDWGPAWVDWRYSEGWVGWAPLPPQAGWSVGVGLSFGNYDIPSFSYCFVEERRFADRNLGRFIALPARNVTLIGLTRRVTNYSFENGRVIDRGISVDRIEKVRGRSIRRYHIEDPGHTVSRRDQFKGDRLELFRPSIASSTPEHAPHVAEHSQRDASLNGMLKRHDQERHKLDDHQTSERAQLDRIHRKEMTNPPNGMAREELKNRQNQERHAFEEQAQRERQVMENRHERERSFEARPAAPMPEGHQRNQNAHHGKGR
jgi:hypothetical protein